MEKERLFCWRGGKDTSDHLLVLRQRLIKEGNFSGRPEDQKTQVHTMIGYINNFSTLTRQEKHSLAQAIDESVSGFTNFGAMEIDRIHLVYYLHRSLYKIVNKISLEFGKDYSGLRSKIGSVLLIDDLGKISEVLP